VSVSVTLPDDLASRLAEEAERRNVSRDELAVSALAEKFPPEAADEAKSALSAFIGGSSSGKKWSITEIDDDQYKREHGFGR